MNGIDIAKSSVFSFLKINILGIFLTITFTAFAIYFILKTGIKFGGLVPHGTIWTSLITICMFKPISIIITIITIIVSIFIPFTFGNKYILKQVAHKIVSEKGENFIKPIIQSSIQKVNNSNPHLLEKGKDLLSFKESFLNTINSSQENKWIKRIITLVIKKMKLDNETINNENVQDVFLNKILFEIKKLAKPSLKFFIPIIVLQIIVLIILRIGIL